MLELINGVICFILSTILLSITIFGGILLIEVVILIIINYIRRTNDE